MPEKKSNRLVIIAAGGLGIMVLLAYAPGGTSFGNQQLTTSVFTFTNVATATFPLPIITVTSTVTSTVTGTSGCPCSVSTDGTYYSATSNFNGQIVYGGLGNLGGISGGDASGVINSALNGGVVVLNAGTYLSMKPILLPSGSQLLGNGSPTIIDQSTSRLPGTAYNGAAIENAHFTVFSFNSDTGITIKGITVKPNSNNIGIALGGVSNFNVQQAVVDLSIGFSGIQTYAATYGSVTDSSVTAPPQTTYYTYGIGDDVGSFVSNPLASNNLSIERDSIMGVNGNAFNYAGTNIDVGYCTVNMGDNTGAGVDDMFLDIEAVGQTTSNVSIHDCSFTKSLVSNSRVGMNAIFAIGQASQGGSFNSVSFVRDAFAVSNNVAVGRGVSIGNSPVVSNILLDQWTLSGMSTGFTYAPYSGLVTVQNGRYIPNQNGFAGSPCFQPPLPGNHPNWVLTNNMGCP